MTAVHGCAAPSPRKNRSALRLLVAGLSLCGQGDERVDDALRSDREGEPARDEGEMREQRVVPGVRYRLPHDVDPHQDRQDQQDGRRHVEHRLARRNGPFDVGSAIEQEDPSGWRVSCCC